MKNKENGFTFVELLAVITILGVLSLIAIPVFDKLVKENKEEIYQSQLNNIILALKNWASDNKEYLPLEDDGVLTLTLGNLKSDGYIDYEIRNPKNSKCFDNGMILKITKVKNSYDYSIDLNSIKDGKDCSINLEKPVIILNGNKIELIEVNSVYNDLGVLAKDSNGEDITNSVSKIITGSSSLVDTSILNSQYIITYTVSANGHTTTESRTVKIVDRTKPDLVIPANETINREETSFDVMRGVSVSDNSGEKVDIKVKSNISFGIPGKYTVTYEAKDSSGNTAIKKRIITISSDMFLKNLAVVDTSLGVNAIAPCAKSGTCEMGTPFAIKVNESEIHKFYVLNDTGREVTLIMDRNLGGKVAWINEEDYNSSGGTDYGTYGNTDKGPLTALKYLEMQTNDWTNIEAYNYTLTDDSGMNRFGTIERTNVRARMLTHTEANSKGCADICFRYLFENLGDSATGYWLSTPSSSDTYLSEFITNLGAISIYPVNLQDLNGVRPVIKITR